MTVVKVEKLHKLYGKTHAVRGISFQVPKGSIYALLGPNGAGKTTTLKCILNLIKPTSGEIEVLNSRKIEKVLDKVAFVPEEKNFYDFLTPTGAIKFCKRLSGKVFNGRKALELMRYFKLPIREKIATFSHGMRTQLYLSLVFAYEAELYVLDEPTWGLDPIVRQDVLNMIRDMAGEKTVLYTSHILSEVEKITDTVSIMLKGRIIFTGELDEAKEKFKCVTTPSHAKVEDLDVILLKSTKEEKIVVVKGEETIEKIMERAQGEVKVENMNLEDIFMAFVRGGVKDDNQ